MKKTFKFFAAALAIVAAASCAKEISNDNIQNETPAEETVHMTISASFDSEGETKTVLAENNLVYWTDEDAIRLFYSADGYDWDLNNGVFSIDPASNDVDPTFAVFSGDTKPSNKYYAVSPSSGWTAPSRMYFQFDGLYSQNAVKDSFYPNAHVAMSVSTSGDVFKFQNACALLKVKVVGDDVYSIKVDGTVGVMDDYYSTPIGLGMPFRFRPGGVDIYQFNNTNGHSSSIVLTSGSGPLENGATYYIVVPHYTVKNFVVSLCDANGNVIASKSKKSDFKIERNKVYDLGTLAYQLKVGDYYYSDGKTGAAYKSNAVGVVFYVGKPQDVDPTIPGGFTKGLVVGLKEYSNLYFGTERDGNTKSLQPDYYNVNTYASSKALASSVLDAASKNIISISNAYEMSIRHNQGTGGSELYSSYNFGTNTYGTGWLIPSAREYSLMYENIDALNSKSQFDDLRVWTSDDKALNASTQGEFVIGYHTVWQANIDGEDGWRCLNYYYINPSTEGVVHVVSNRNNQDYSQGVKHLGRAFFAF